MNARRARKPTSVQQPPAVLVRPGLAFSAGLSQPHAGTLEDSASAVLLVCESASGSGAANAALAGFAPASELPAQLFGQKSADPVVSSFQALQTIAERANRRVWNKSRYRVSSDLRAALSAILISDQYAYLLNVGDNHVYLLRGKGIRTVVAGARQQELYLGDQIDLPELTAAGRPDFIHSFTLRLQPDDRLIVCTKSLQKQLAASAPGKREDVVLAEIVRARASQHYNPADAARALSADAPAGAAKAIWYPFQLPDAARPAEAPAASAQPPAAAQLVLDLAGGAAVLWCANQAELARTARLRRQRAVSQRAIGLFAVLSVLAIVLALTSQGLGLWSQSQAAAAQTAISATETGQAASPVTTPTTTPINTATALAVLALSPVATPGGLTVTPQSARTPTPTRAPTATFTPSPTTAPTATFTPSPTITPTATAATTQ